MAEKYDYRLRLLHWTLAVLIIVMLAAGFIIAGMNGKVNPSKYTLLMLHESFGVIILLLLLWRMALRISTYMPPFPAKIAPIYRKLAKPTHYILYFFMLIMPLSGALGSMLNGYNVKFFGLNLPNLMPLDKPLGSSIFEIHEIAPYIFIGFIVLHLAAFIKHQLCDKVDLFSRVSWKK